MRSELLGLVATALVICAYVPQVSHLVREHCSAGISLQAFGLWLVSSGLLFVHAAMIGDPIFALLQIVNLIATGIIIVCARRYRGSVCATHLHHFHGT